MLKKRIANIVFYKVPNGTETTKQATIFYKDGSVSTVSFEEGIDACEEIVKERNIQTKDAFKEMINRDVVHVVSAKEFRENFNRYVSAVTPEFNREEHMESTRVQTPVVPTESQSTDVPARAATTPAEETAERTSAIPVAPTTTETEAVEARGENGDIDTTDVLEEEAEDVEAVEEAAEETPVEARTSTTPVAPVIVPGSAVPAGRGTDESEDDLYHFTDDEDEVPAAEEEIDDLEDEEVLEGDGNTDPFDNGDDAEEAEEEEEKEGFFKRIINKIKKNKIVKRVLLCVTALAVALGLYSCSQRKTLEGEMYNSNLPSYNETIQDEIPDQELAMLRQNAVVQSNFYEDARISALLKATSNQTQKTAMTNLGTAMDGFNNTFSAYYLEKGKDVRASLKFDEVVALQVAYNDYSKDELKAYFNGADIRAEDLTRAYKDGSLQLMGAYAMENSDHPVDMSMLIESEEGKEFYNRYHEAFLAAKEATGDEKLRLVKEFYAMVRADFPITNEVRMEGISHAENYEQLEAYKLSVTPMIAAGEMLWQNLDVDYTLGDGEIDFINDLGLCNFAQKTFERAELIALTSEADKKNPLYDDYRNAFINYYTQHGIYYVDDAHRELTELDSFQEAVNGHHLIEDDGTWVYEGSTWTTTETRTETTTHTETDTTYHEEVTETELPITPEAKAEVDAQIEAENEQARIEAERRAEEERKRLQEEADREADRVRDEVRRDEEDLQDRIDDANKVIDENHKDNDPSNDKPVNEKDLGHGVEFDRDHSDGNGNLDSSVENVTTDPTGDMTDQPLPDPNATGKKFDEQAENYNSGKPSGQAFVESEEPVVSGDDSQWVETVPVDDDYYYEDAWVEYGDGSVETVSYEAAVDNYVEALATDSDSYGSNLQEEDVDSYQYTK